MVPMAFLHAASHLTFVLGLGKGAVSFLQTVKAAEACFTSLVSFLLQGQVSGSPGISPWERRAQGGASTPLLLSFLLLFF